MDGARRRPWRRVIMVALSVLVLAIAGLLTAWHFNPKLETSKALLQFKTGGAVTIELAWRAALLAPDSIERDKLLVQILDDEGWRKSPKFVRRIKMNGVPWWLPSCGDAWTLSAELREHYLKLLSREESAERDDQIEALLLTAINSTHRPGAMLWDRVWLEGWGRIRDRAHPREPRWVRWYRCGRVVEDYYDRVRSSADLEAEEAATLVEEMLTTELELGQQVCTLWQCIPSPAPSEQLVGIDAALMRTAWSSILDREPTPQREELLAKLSRVVVQPSAGQGLRVIDMVRADPVLGQDPRLPVWTQFGFFGFEVLSFLATTESWPLEACVSRPAPDPLWDSAWDAVMTEVIADLGADQGQLTFSMRMELPYGQESGRELLVAIWEQLARTRESRRSPSRDIDFILALAAWEIGLTGVPSGNSRSEYPWLKKTEIMRLGHVPSTEHRVRGCIYCDRHPDAVDGVKANPDGSLVWTDDQGMEVVVPAPGCARLPNARVIGVPPPHDAAPSSSRWHRLRYHGDHTADLLAEIDQWPVGSCLAGISKKQLEATNRAVLRFRREMEPWSFGPHIGELVLGVAARSRAETFASGLELSADARKAVVEIIVALAHERNGQHGSLDFPTGIRAENLILMYSLGHIGIAECDARGHAVILSSQHTCANCGVVTVPRQPTRTRQPGSPR